MHVAVLAALKPRSVRLFGEWGRSVWRRVGPALRNGASTEGAAVSKLDEASQELKEPWEAETGMQTRVHVTGRRRDIPGGGAEPERAGGQPGCTARCGGAGWSRGLRGGEGGAQGFISRPQLSW